MLCIDLMHNDVKQCFRSSNVHCGSCSQERIQYDIIFPQSSTAIMCSEVAGHGPSSSGWGDLFELSDRSHKTDPESLNRAIHYWPPSWI